ncbi:uncharacterized protein LOC143897712 isoform X2 [Temnothorax americanus]|uniref:uncharacterized protein LOC143897712 isoform X2 n=2 Tax=Temnothorax americanus TaxID=1964332 RepID=UPI004068B25F
MAAYVDENRVNNHTMEDLLGSIVRDEAGNIIVNEDGFVTCISKDLSFQIEYNEIDFTKDTLECTVGDKRVFIKLNDNEANKENCSSSDLDINRAFTWTDASTKLFIELYKEKKELLTNRKIKTRKILWQRICESMKMQGFDVTPTQVENKMKSLERSYKNMITNNKQTGRGRMTCPYERELTELLGYKHNVEPVAVSGKEGTVIRKDRVSTFQTEAREEEIFIDANQKHRQNVDTNHYNNETTLSLQEDLDEGGESSVNIMLQKNTISQNLSKVPQKSARTQVGTTGRVLEKCHKTLDTLTENILIERNAKLDVQKQILAEYKRISTIYEDMAKTIKEQLTTANNLRQERNKLLRDLVSLD